MEAIRLGNFNVTRLLLDTDVDIHGRLTYNRFIDGDNCWTLWDDSARRKKEPWYSAKSSLFSGFPVLQWSALHIAVWRGQWQVVKLLIKRRANPNLRDYYHRAALDLAIELSDLRSLWGYWTWIVLIWTRQGCPYLFQIYWMKLFMRNVIVP